MTHINTTPTEDAEQRTVVQWLQWYNVAFAHVPNGGKRTKAEGGIFKALGVSPGIPDLLIFDAPPIAPDYAGTAIELKRQTGGKLSHNQREWLDKLEKRGWLTAVCKGADEAIAQLEAWGYGQGRGAYKNTAGQNEWQAE